MPWVAVLTAVKCNNAAIKVPCTAADDATADFTERESSSKEVLSQQVARAYTFTQFTFQRP